MTSLENHHHFLEILSGFHVVHGTLNLLAFCQPLSFERKKNSLWNCCKISINVDLIGFASQITFFMAALLQWLEKSLSFFINTLDISVNIHSQYLRGTYCYAKAWVGCL